ncbi:MAG: Asp-tRNA(Asn)/Glu-tRNA(Gln) amidotransferase subunit GatA [Oceanococcus sp.]
MHTLGLRDLAQGLRQKQFSAVELAQHFLARIDVIDGDLNSLISRTDDIALAQAALADAALSAGEAGPLTGIPLIHKDVFLTQGVRTSCASRMLDNFVAPFDGTVVAKLKQAGTVMLGKANMDEFAMGSSNETSFYGACKNPWDKERVPGGSSGGSAAAVAAGLAPIATGTDTGGSVRQPAAFTGLTGLKPTYGRCSRWGMVAFASSLDQAGGFARSAEDVAFLTAAMAGFDERDSTSAQQPVDDYVAGLQQPLAGIKIGKPREYFAEGLDSGIATAVEAAIAQYQALGAEIVDISLPNTHLSVPTYYVVAPAEASSNLARFDGVRYGHRCENPVDLKDLYSRSRGEGFGREVQRRIMIGAYVLSHGYYDAYYLQAQRVRQIIANDFAAAFEQVDLIIGPTTPTPAFKLGEKSQDPVTMYLDDIYTTSVNLAGLPALSAPCGFVQGLPVGMQLIGPQFAESRLLSAAHAYQQATDWHTQRAEVAQ